MFSPFTKKHNKKLKQLDSYKTPYTFRKRLEEVYIT